MKNNIFIGVIGILVGFAVAYALFGNQQPVVRLSSAVGTTFNTAKVAQINFSPATASATSTSILNTDESDRYVESAYVACGSVGTSQTAYTGAGLAALVFTAGTTTANAPATPTASALQSMLVTVSTSTTDSFIATTTYTSPFSRRWNAGSYMTFFSNATNTAACTVGVHYLAS